MHSKVYSLDFLRKSLGPSGRIPPALRAVNNSPPEGGVRPPCALRLLASRPRLRRSRAWGLQPPDPLGFAPCAAFASRAPFTRRHREGLLQAVFFSGNFYKKRRRPAEKAGGGLGGHAPLRQRRGGQLVPRVGNRRLSMLGACCPCRSGPQGTTRATPSDGFRICRIASERAKEALHIKKAKHFEKSPPPLLQPAWALALQRTTV